MYYQNRHIVVNYESETVDRTKKCTRQNRTNVRFTIGIHEMCGCAVFSTVQTDK